MNSYLLTLYVTIEQELAIRSLFITNGWDFRKYQDYSFPGYEDIKTEVNGIANEQLSLDVTALVSGTSEYKDNKNINNPTSDTKLTILSEVIQGFSSDSDTIQDGELFSDLESFVEKSLKHETKRLKRGSCKLNLKNKITSPNLCIDKDNRKDVDKISQSAITDVVHANTQNDSCVYNFDVECNDLSDSDSYTDVSKIKIKYGQMRKIINGETSFSGVKTDLKCKSSNYEDDASEIDNNDYVHQNISSSKSELPFKTKKGKFHCKDCNTTFKLLGPYNKHKREGGKCVFTCEYCGKVYKSRYYSNYKSHLKYHINDRSYQCKLCDKTYVQLQALNIHMRKHSGEKPFICDICGKRFYASSNLICHKNSSHTDSLQVFQCDLCGTSLKSVYSLRVHKNTVHTEDRPFTCEVCGNNFKTKKSLIVHGKVHKEIYPFVCEFEGCKKAFKRQEGITSHMKRHLNKRTHFCKTCEKGFYEAKELRLHMRTHSGEKPFSCQQCGYKCALAGNLRKHMKTHQ